MERSVWDFQLLEGSSLDLATNKSESVYFVGIYLLMEYRTMSIYGVMGKPSDFLFRSQT